MNQTHFNQRSGDSAITVLSVVPHYSCWHFSRLQ